MAKTDNDNDELEELTNTLLVEMRKHDRLVNLSALNYCIAAIIRVHFNGAEAALRLSDEQTRLAVAYLSRHETSNRLH